MEKTFEEIKHLDLKIYQPLNGYRYNEDSFILIDFIKHLRKNSKVIELCAGSGIIGLTLLKRFPQIKMTFIEIDKNMFEILLENIKINNLEDRAQPVLTDYKKIEKYHYCSYDYLVANPPYRKPGTGKISPNKIKAYARHELSGTLEDLIHISSLLLKDRGKIFLVFLAERVAELILIMNKYSIEAKILQFVYSKKDAEAKLVLIEGIKKAKRGLKILPPIFTSNNMI